MKHSLLITGGIIIIILPGGLTVLVACGLIFPKYRQRIFNLIKKTKGDIKMAMEIIIGRKSYDDTRHVSKENLTEIDSSRINGVDKAFSYLEAKHAERMSTFTPAMMVGCFGIGAALIVALWIMSSIFPV